MKYILVAFFLLAATKTFAQYYINDSVQWKLSTNDSATSKLHPFGLHGAKQKLAAELPAPTYVNGFQKITKPTNGWPSTIDVVTNNSYIDFPFGFPPDICFDTISGYRYCLGYSFFYLKLIKVAGFNSQTNSTSVIDVYFFDTSCYASNRGTNFQYLGEVRFNSSNPQKPAKIELVVPETNNVTPYACGAAGRYSSIRFYPKQGEDFFIKDVTIGGTSGALLPIHFKSIKANYRDRFIDLNWQIDNIRDLDKFIVERSKDGISFSNAAIVYSTGSTISNVFQWKDETPLQGNNFYRVKAIEKSGKVITSQVVTVTNASIKSGINVYPNPVINRSLNLTLQNIPTGNIRMLLTNQVGQVVYSTSFKHNGDTQKQIQLSKSILPGVYLLRIEADAYRWHSKIMLQ